MKAFEPFDAKFVGQPLLRSEDLRLLRGKGQYVDDLHRDGMLHAAILRSQVAHGRLRSIDATAARALRGVHGVYTADDVLHSFGGTIPVIPLRLGTYCRRLCSSIHLCRGHSSQQLLRSGPLFRLTA